MNEKVCKNVRFAYSLLISAMLAVIAVLFVTSCIGIYNTGHQPFTREHIGEAFAKISIPVYVTLALLLCQIILYFILPVEKEKKAVKIDVGFTVKRLGRKLSLADCSEKTAAAISSERFTRRLLLIFGAVGAALSLIYPLIYIFTPGHLENADGAIMCSLIILEFLSPVFVYAVVAMYISKRSLEREAELLKGEIARLKEDGTPVSDIQKVERISQKKKEIILLCVRLSLIVLAVTFIIIGAANGAADIVFGKASQICT